MTDDETDLTDELESADCLEDQLDVLYDACVDDDTLDLDWSSDDDDSECDNCLGQGFDKYGFVCTMCQVQS